MFLIGHEIVLCDRKMCDLTSPDQIERLFISESFDLIINAAAFTEVDLAEEKKELAYKINCNAPKLLAKKAFELNVPIIHFSTDYVFDGLNDEKYTENDPTNPINVYGESKLAGELAIKESGAKYYIFRTSWVYSNWKKNFFMTILRLCNEKKTIRIINDQNGIPTSAGFIAKQINFIIPKLNEFNVGTYNLVPDSDGTWYDFAVSIIKLTNIRFRVENIIPILSSDFKTLAKRPKNSILSNKKIKKIFMLKFKTWQEELDEFIKDFR